MRWFRRIADMLRPWRTTDGPHRVARRGPVNHVVIIDGTMSTLLDGCETNAGLAYKLMCEMAPSPDMSLYYHRGVQWQSWRNSMDVVRGRGINRQIRRAYGQLASRYRPGDRIFLIGYSRGAFAVRSLAGMIDQVGLLKATAATERNILQTWRHYELSPGSDSAHEFSNLYCHPIGRSDNGDEGVTIEMIGVWDTVKALGFRAPVIWRLVNDVHEFHSHELGHSVRHGYQALALDETRQAFEPMIWETPGEWRGNVEQMWFKGSHGDVGGQLGGHEYARPLSNIPFVWILERAEALGVHLPEGWRNRFPRDADAPPVGSVKGWGKLFLNRRRRTVGRDVSELIHESARGHRGLGRIVRGDLNEIALDQQASEESVPAKPTGNNSPEPRPVPAAHPATDAE